MKSKAKRIPIRPGSALADEFWETGKCGACPVYDMHGHMGDLASIYMPAGDADAMVRIMDRAGVRVLCFSHHGALMAAEVGNEPSIAAVRRHPKRFRAYIAVNPHYPEVARREMERFDAMKDVFVGFKFLADYYEAPLSGEGHREALEFANERGLALLTHTWSGSVYDGPEEVMRVAGKYPNVTFILGHSFNDDWQEAADVARDYPNTYLELTSVLGRRGVVEFFCGHVGSGRLLFGVDLPWFEEHHGIGALLSCDITDDDIHNICHRNAEGILKRLAERGVDVGDLLE